MKEKKQQRKFQNELKNVKKRRNKLKQIVTRKIFSMAEKTQILSRNIEQFKKEKNLLNNIEQIKKNKNLLQNKLEQFKKALWNRK